MQQLVKALKQEMGTVMAAVKGNEVQLHSVKQTKLKKTLLLSQLCSVQIT